MRSVEERNKPVEPNFANSAWEVCVKLCERILVQVTARDTSDEDRAGLSRGGVLFTDKILLTDGNEMGHFAFDEVPNPN